MLGDNWIILVTRLKNGRYQWRGVLNKRARACLVGFYTYKSEMSARRAGNRAYVVLWPPEGMP